MNKDHVKKALASLTIAGLVAGGSLTLDGCKSKASCSEGKSKVESQTAEQDTTKQDTTKSSCGQGSCGQKADTTKSSCGQSSCSK